MGGIGDIIKAIEQKYFERETVEDYDLVEMIKAASEKVATQKLLLVAHSQGNFYANSFYDYVTGSGGRAPSGRASVPSESLGVYGVANPASRVAGGGKWLTSDTDKIIAGVAASAPFRQIMKPNTHIELSGSDGALGHNFSDIYLKYRGAQIVSDIEKSLDALKTNSIQDETKPCIAAPPPTVAHKIAGAFFAIADPAAGAGIALASDVVKGVSAVGLVAANLVGVGPTQFAAVGASDIKVEPRLRPAEEHSDVLDPPERTASERAGNTSITRQETKTDQSEKDIKVEPRGEVQPSEIPPPVRLSPQGGGGGGVSNPPPPSDSAAAAQEPSPSLLPASSSPATATSSAPSDTTPPDLVFFSPTCAASLSASGCLVATTTLAFEWSSNASDFSYFVLNQNGIVSTTTSTSTTASASDGVVYFFAVSAHDSAGNASATSTKNISISLAPVVINEVAWAGTLASVSDEWIELYNRTTETISLSNFVLYAADLSPYLPLSGTIAPHGYYLIERKNTGETDEATESAVLGVTADLWTSFGLGLNNNGDQLTLVLVRSSSGGWATTTIDQTSVCTGGGTSWCGGSSSGSYLSMERYDTETIGTSSSNWYSHLGEFILNGTDTNNIPINGTPRSRNGISFLITPPSTLSVNKTLTSANSPYLVPRSGLTIANGVTLILGAGVVIKVVPPNSPSITVNGTLVANGTAEAPVVFTAFADDSYGGDTNGNGAATAPAAGHWRNLYFSPSSTGSSLTHTFVRYSGNSNISDTAARKGAVGVSGSSVSFSHLTVEYSNFHGLALENSNSTVTHSLFQHNTNGAVSGTGLTVEGGAPTIRDNTIRDNRYGAMLTRAGGSFSNNIISDNAESAVYATKIGATLSGNSGSGNGSNAFLIDGTLTQTGATTTLAANPLPYLIKGQVSIVSNSALVLGNGVVVKGYHGSSYGNLTVRGGAVLASEGDSSDDLIFTSVRDSSVGGTTEAGFPAPAPGNWYGITVEAGGRLALSGFTLKYAGAGASLGFPVLGESAGALKVVGSAATTSGSIAHALFEHNYQSGLNLENVSALSVSDTIFANHTEKRSRNASGIYAAGSTATFADLSFSNNEKDAVGAGINTISCTNCGTPVTIPANLFSP